MEKQIIAVIAYDGSRFYGMQIQPNKPTIQGEIENALKKLNINSKITHAGRTDKGVHALNQVISFKVPEFWEEEKLKNLLNQILFPSIYIKTIKKAPLNFHPRYAKKRSYRYLLSPTISPFTANYLTHYQHTINYPLLQKALNTLKGTHDFTHFAKTGSDVKDYTRTIYLAKIFPYKNLSVINIQGNGFLRGQIRIIVDFLLKINENILTIDDLKAQLEGKLISKHLAPPNGLYLERVWYHSTLIESSYSSSKLI